MTELPLKAIKPNPNQPRKYFDRESIRALADNIQEVGLLTPILVRPKGKTQYEIVHGERRWRAVKILGWKAIPADVREMTDDEVYMASLSENVVRNDLSSIEEAEAYRKLIDGGMKQVVLSKTIGTSRPYISNKLRLLTLPPGARRYFLERRLTDNHGFQLLKLKGMHPEGLRATRRWQAKPFEMSLKGVSLPKRAGLLQYFMSDHRVEDLPPVYMAFQMHLLDEDHDNKSVLQAFEDFRAFMAEQDRQPLQWELAAFWWATVAVVLGLSVKDLRKCITDWHERYVSAIGELTLMRKFSADTGQDGSPAQKRQIRRTWLLLRDVFFSSSLAVQHDEKGQVEIGIFAGGDPVFDAFPMWREAGQRAGQKEFLGDGEWSWAWLQPYPSRLQVEMHMGKRYSTEDDEPILEDEPETQQIAVDEIKPIPLPLDWHDMPDAGFLAFDLIGVDVVVDEAKSGRIVLRKTKD